MKKSEISSKSSARSREEIMARSPKLLSTFKLTGGEEAAKHLRGRKLAELQHQYSVTADHTSKSCIEVAIEKLGE